MSLPKRSKCRTHCVFRKQFGFEDERRLHLSLTIMGLVTHVALGLTIGGGVMTGTNATPDDKGQLDKTQLDKVHTGINLKHIGAFLFLAAYASIVCATTFLWSNKGRIMKYRRTVSLSRANI